MGKETTHTGDKEPPRGKKVVGFFDGFKPPPLIVADLNSMRVYIRGVELVEIGPIPLRCLIAMLLHYGSSLDRDALYRRYHPDNNCIHTDTISNRVRNNIHQIRDALTRMKPGIKVCVNRYAWWVESTEEPWFVFSRQGIDKAEADDPIFEGIDVKALYEKFIDFLDNGEGPE